MASDLGPLVAIVGETASGKSALAIKLAKIFNGEVICADSWTVYRGFDIGTAKPSAAERRAVPHHLLDVADPREGFNAAVFKDLALAKITEISSRGKLPMLVGGTGLYIDAVIYDYSFLPAPDKQLRSELNNLSLGSLLQKAAAHGLQTESIDIHNKRRIIRLIENDGKLPTSQGLRPDTLILGVKVDSKDRKSRVVARVEAMLSAGLEQEATKLAALYGWDIEPMKGIGYREWQARANGQASFVETKEKIIKSTMELSKRQRTWFKRNKSIQWIEQESKAVEIITAFLSK